LKILLVTVFFLTFTIVELSACLRLQQAGIGCENFPGCYGYLPQLSAVENSAVPALQSFLQKIHRAVALLLVLITGVIAYRVFRSRSSSHMRNSVMLMIVMLVILSVIGPYTAQKQYPLLAVANGGFGLVLLLVIAGVLWRNDSYRCSFASGFRLRTATVLSMFFVAGVILSGVWSSANYASLAAPVATELSINVSLPNNTNTSIKEAFNPLRELRVDDDHRVLPDATLPLIRTGHHLAALLFVLITVPLCIIIIFKRPAQRPTTAVVLTLMLADCLLGRLSLAGAESLLLLSGHHFIAVLLVLMLLKLILRLNDKRVDWSVP
jgi:cytochrome c oxidase assembly protein subunit 15